jgi:putative DeoR family transcriptional regulator (stage III sporulation protein D)
MLFYIKKRILEEGRYIAETGATVRDTAKKFSLSKSTVHKDVSEKLKKIDKKLYKKVRAVLDKNLLERHIRGGEATRLKFYPKKIVDK